MASFKEWMFTLMFMVIFCIIAFSGIYWYLALLDSDCAKRYAEDFCQEKGFEFKELQGISFLCEEELDKRKNPYGRSHEFYFLEEEIENCMTKEQYSFKKYALDKQDVGVKG